MSIQGVKGMQDLLPPESALWRAIETLAADVFSGFGYDEIRTPILEHTDLFARSIGDESDIVSKEMYTFEDKAGRSVTMRPEGTASVVRAFLQNKLHARQGVHRLFYMGPMFRYERMQKGRLRQFHQFGAELYGLATPLADAEVIALQHFLFQRLGVPGLALEINNLGTPASRAEYGKRLREHLQSEAGVLCADCIRRTETNPLRALDCKIPGCQPVLAAAPSILECSDPESDAHFKAVLERLDVLGIPYQINPQMVRGLDYYTKVVFEFTSTGLGAKNTLSAGGRYDRLVKDLGGPETPAVGFACGVERLLLLLGDSAQSLLPHVPKLFLVLLEPEAESQAATLVAGLRTAGLHVEEDFNRPGLKAQMKGANRAGADWVILVGPDEFAAKVVTLRDMRSGEQRSLPMETQSILDAIGVAT